MELVLWSAQVVRSKGAQVGECSRWAADTRPGAPGREPETFSDGFCPSLSGESSRNLLPTGLCLSRILFSATTSSLTQTWPSSPVPSCLGNTWPMQGTVGTSHGSAPPEDLAGMRTGFLPMLLLSHSSRDTTSWQL